MPGSCGLPLSESAALSIDFWLQPAEVARYLLQHQRTYICGLLFRSNVVDHRLYSHR
jgi:hypothetical protein